MTWHPGIPQEYRNKIVTGDARELSKQIPDNSIDLIFTDPPYLKEYIYLYAWLSEEAARILKPDGFLITYVGVYWKDKVMSLLGEHMKYYWDFILVNTGKSPIMWKRKIISRHKSIMAYSKNDKALPSTNVLSFWRGSGEDKRYHTWGQDESSARYYIDCFTDGCDVVLDPFMGGGTTAYVCRQLRLNFIGFEKENDEAEIARKRVREAQLPLIEQKTKQLEMQEQRVDGT